MDNSKISAEQIWTTLTYINRECLEGFILDDDEINDIIEMIEKLISKNDIKYINDVRSLEILNNILNIKIVKEKDKYKVKRMQEQ